MRKVFDFAEVMFDIFPKKSFHASLWAFSKRFLGLDYVWRSQLTQISNQRESSLFRWGNVLGEKSGRSRVIFRWRHRGLNKATWGSSFLFLVNETRQKFEYLERLIHYVTLVVGNLWPKNHKLTSKSPRGLAN